MDCSLPGSSVHGVLQAGTLEWAAISFSRGSSKPRNWSCLLYCRQILYWLSYKGSSHQLPWKQESFLWYLQHQRTSQNIAKNLATLLKCSQLSEFSAWVIILYFYITPMYYLSSVYPTLADYELLQEKKGTQVLFIPQCLTQNLVNSRCLRNIQKHCVFHDLTYSSSNKCVRLLVSTLAI